MSILDPKTNIRSDEREIVLEGINGKPKTTSGLVDRRLLTGENNLYCVMNPQTCLWTFKQKHGILPEVLRKRWTSFTKAKEFAEGYYKRRDIIIKEVID